MYKQAGGKEKRGREKARLVAAVARRRGKTVILKAQTKEGRVAGKTPHCHHGAGQPLAEGKRNVLDAKKRRQEKGREGKRSKEQAGSKMRGSNKKPRYTA